LGCIIRTTIVFTRRRRAAHTIIARADGPI
jgi:hypothetical protein